MTIDLKEMEKKTYEESVKDVHNHVPQYYCTPSLHGDVLHSDRGSLVYTLSAPVYPAGGGHQ
jgi:hypothetical protein